MTKAKLKTKKSAAVPAESKDPTRYINREESWLRFNERVLEEAENINNPLLERLKFLAIFESNLDEFYMVRVSGLIEQEQADMGEITPDGLTASEQLLLIAEMARPMRQRAGQVWSTEIRPEIEKQGVVVKTYADLTPAQRAAADEYFLREVFPVCTPLLLHPAANVPFISNRSLNLAVVLADPAGAGTRLARVKIPTVVPRFMRLARRRHDFVLIEDLIRHNLHHLFPGVEIVGAYGFRVIRDADIEIRELEAADLVARIEQTIRLRRFGDPVLLQMEAQALPEVRKILMRLLALDKEDLFELDGMLGLEALWELASVDKPSLRFPTHVPHVPERLDTSDDLFEEVAKRDLIVSQPYDSFRTVEKFIAGAARDPEVIGIKQTLYRVGAKSPIVESLLDAAENGKQVAAMVELKARFDESNNLVWARALERAGVHVTYGFAEFKTHAKLCLVVRREAGGIRTYAHIGTGNYNPDTSRIYTDLGLFTSDPDITQDIAELFNFLTGFTKTHRYRKILVAPVNLREGVIARIRREAEHHSASRPGRIIFKLNSLVDPEVIDALYSASQAGVQIDLIVRGICCLRPQVPALSPTIRVVSIVGRFLEHSRAFWFANQGKPELFIGSADLMSRNLDRRVEVLAPVSDPGLIDLIRSQVLESALTDQTNAWRLASDGSYSRTVPSVPNPHSSQQQQIKNPLLRTQLER